MGSPGFERVRQFGPVVGGGNTPGSYIDEGLDVPYRALEVFEVAGWNGRAAIAPLDDAVVVAGGPESLLGLADRGWLAGRPVVLAADAGRMPEARRDPTVLTDGLRRREVFFGRSSDNVSQTLTRDDEPVGLASAPDYLEDGWEDHLTVAAVSGVRSVTASSSGSDPTAVGGARRDRHPWAAVDGDPRTAWRSDPGAEGRASWTLTLDGPRPLGSVQIRTVSSADAAADVRVRTDGGSVTVRDVAPGRWTDVALPAGVTRRLTVSADPVGSLASFGLAEVRAAGLHAERTLVMPDGGGTGPVWLAADAGFQRPDCYPLVGTMLCSPQVGRRAEEGGSLDRTAVIPAGSYAAQVTAAPRPGPGLDAWLDSDAPAEVSASSTADAGAAGRPGALLDGDEGTGWRAAPGDDEPWVRVTWPDEVTLDWLQLARGGTLAASFPTQVRVVSDDGAHLLRVSADGRVDLPRTTTREITIRLTTITLAGTFDPFLRRSDLLPVGFSELRWSGARVPARTDDVLQVPCGAGPELEADGQVLKSAGTVSYADVVSGRPVDFAVCGGPATVAVDGGSTRVQARHSAAWDVATFSLAPATGGTPAASGTDRPARASRVPAASAGHGNALRMSIASRDEAALLWVRQSHNPGWVASLAGEELEPVRVDGWQQGFLVPPGPAGEVELRFAPDRTYRLGLAIGAIAVLLLVLGAVRRPRPGGDRPALREGGLAAVAPAVVLGVLLLAVGWWVLPISLVGWLAARWAVRRWSLTAATMAVAAGGLALSGLALAARPWPGQGYSAGSGWSQALCVLSLVAVWVSVTSRGYAGTRDRNRITGLSSDQ